MYKFMERDLKEKKRTFMEKVSQGEKIQFMKRDEKEGVMKIISSAYNDNNLQQEESVEVNNNSNDITNNSYKNEYNAVNNFPPILTRGQCNNFMTNNRMNINGAICYEDHNYGINLFIDGKETKLTNFIIQAEKIQIIDDGIHKEKLYVLRCQLIGQFGISKRIKLHSKDLINSDWIKIKLGIEFSIYDEQLYKILEIYIGKLFANVRTEVKYEHVGWRLINNKWIYLHGGGAIGVNNCNVKGVKDKVLEVDYGMNRIQALNEVLNMLEIAEYHKTVPMFLYTHLSVLKDIFNTAGANPNFLLWLEGLTGSRKTSIAKVFFNIYNRSNDYISATFKDTIGSLEEKSFQYKDSSLILDDFFHSVSKQEWNYTQQTASEMIRRYGDNFSKSRLNKNMERGKEYPPRGMLVITGELTMRGESTISRYISIGIEKNDINTEILKYHQENPKILSTHLYYFIEWASNNSEKIIKYITANFRSLRSKNQGKYRHGRFIETFTIYQLICEIFLNYCVELGRINEETKQTIFYEWEKYIYEAILIHEKANLQQDPAIMYLQALQQLICVKDIILNPKGSKGNNNAIGYEDDENYYLSSELVLQQIIKYWKKFSIEFPATNEMINKALDALGVIKTKKEVNKIRRTHKISGDTRRFLIIDKLKMDDLLNNIN